MNLIKIRSMTPYYAWVRDTTLPTGGERSSFGSGTATAIEKTTPTRMTMLPSQRLVTRTHT
eukprot:scaffold26982_cov46-Attheya_sp.AAC.3